MTNKLLSDDNALEKFIQERKEQMLDEQKRFHEEWEYAESQVNSNITEDEMREGLNISLSRMIIEYALAEELNAFSSIEFISPDAEERHIEVMVNAAKDDVLERNMYDYEVMKAKRARRIYGVCPMFVRYESKTLVTKDLEFNGIDEVWHDTMQVEDGIKITAITDPRNFLLDPAAEDIHTAEDCALMIRLTKAQFDNAFSDQKYKKLEVEENVLNQPHAELNLLTTTQDQKISNQAMVDVLYYWNVEHKIYAILAGGKIIYKSNIPYWHQQLPFAAMHMYRRSGTFWSMGVPKVLEHIETSYNELVRETLRAAKLSFPIITTGETTMLDATNLQHYPGLILPGGKDNIQLQALGSVPGEVYGLLDELKKQAILATGVNFEQVYDTKSDRVGIESLKKESQVLLITSNVRQNEQIFLARLGFLLERTIQQYYPVPQIVPLTNAVQMEEFDKTDQKMLGDKLVGVRYRQVRLTDMMLNETRDGERWKLSADKNKGKGYFYARPEYLRSRSPLLTRVIRPSAMGGSKEAKKLAAQELLAIATDANALATQSQQPPVFDIQGIGSIIAELSEFPVDRILAKGTQPTAESKIRQTLSPLQELFSQPQTFTPPTNVLPQEGVAPANSGANPQPIPAQ